MLSLYGILLRVKILRTLDGAASPGALVFIDRRSYRKSHISVHPCLSYLTLGSGYMQREPWYASAVIVIRFKQIPAFSPSKDAASVCQRSRTVLVRVRRTKVIIREGYACSCRV